MLIISEGQVAVRPFNSQEDSDFLFNSWMRSYRYATTQWLYFEKISPEVFFTAHRRGIERTLERAEVAVLASPEDLSQIFGFVAFEKLPGQFVLHYIYIKQAYRGLGIGTAALKEIHDEESEQFLYTHLTKPGLDFLRHLQLKNKPIFNPYWEGNHLA